MVDGRRRLSGWGRRGGVALYRRRHGCRISERIHRWRRSWSCFSRTRDIAFSPSFDTASCAFFEAKRGRFQENLVSKMRPVNVVYELMRELANRVRVFPHWPTTQSQSVSFDGPDVRLCSAKRFRRSTSSSVHAPDAPAGLLAAMVKVEVVAVAAGGIN